MAMGLSSGDGVVFYDPFYRANTTRSVFRNGDSFRNSRYNDDFNVFNCVHISKPQTLSLNVPTRATLELRPESIKPVAVVTGAAMISGSTVLPATTAAMVTEEAASVPSAITVGNEMPSV